MYFLSDGKPTRIHPCFQRHVGPVLDFYFYYYIHADNEVVDNQPNKPILD